VKEKGKQGIKRCFPETEPWRGAPSKKPGQRTELTVHQRSGNQKIGSWSRETNAAEGEKDRLGSCRTEGKNFGSEAEQGSRWSKDGGQGTATEVAWGPGLWSEGEGGGTSCRKAYAGNQGKSKASFSNRGGKVQGPPAAGKRSRVVFQFERVIGCTVGEIIVPVEGRRWIYGGFDPGGKGGVANASKRGSSLSS